MITNHKFSSFSLHSNLIVSIFSQIFYPWTCLVTTSIDDLQVPNLESWHCKEWNLKLYIDWHFLVIVSFWWFNCWKLEFCVQNVLFVSCKLFDCPLKSIILGNINGASSWACKVWIFNILWNWHKDVNIIGNWSFFVIALNFNQESDFSTWRLLNNNVNTEQWFNSDIESVTHKFEFSIWRNESNKSFIFELSKSDTLMELDIVELNGFGFWSSSLSFIVSFIIETKFKIGHTWQLTVSVYNTNDLRLDDIIWRTDKHAKFLNDIEEEFVFTVFDSFRSPRYNVGNLCWNAAGRGWFFWGERIGQLVRLGFDESLEEFDFGSLGVTIIHHLI